METGKVACPDGIPNRMPTVKRSLYMLHMFLTRSEIGRGIVGARKDGGWEGGSKGREGGRNEGGRE